MKGANPILDPWFAKPRTWQAEVRALRVIALGCGLVEERKWYQPCYTYAGGNVGVIADFKASCAFAFFKGTLMADLENVLEAPGEHSRAGRLMRFTSVEQVAEREATLRAYIAEAVEIEKSGRKVDFEIGRDMPLPDELARKFADDPVLKDAFDALTPGRRREYLLHFSGAKQSATRTARIERNVDRIMAGRGMRDR